MESNGPSIANLYRVAGKQSQRAFAYAILDNLRAQLVLDHDHVRLHARVRIAAASAKGAGRFMMVLPGSNVCMLSGDEYIDNVHIRFGLELSHRIHNHTSCGCGKRPGDFFCSQQFMDHVLSCVCTEGTRLVRHNLLLPIFAKFAKKLGFVWDTRSQSLGFAQILDVLGVPDPGKMRLDAIAHYRADQRKSLGIDLTVWHAGARSIRKHEAAAVGEKARNYTTKIAEEGKLAKYADLCRARGIKFLPAAFNSLGGWGSIVLRDFVEPYFDDLRSAEKAETGLEWNALHERELLFQAVSVAIAKGNSMILDTLDHDWRGCGVHDAQSFDTNRARQHIDWVLPSPFVRDLTVGAL